MQKKQLTGHIATSSAYRTEFHGAYNLYPLFRKPHVNLEFELSSE